MTTYLFAGGGTAGHVNPLLAVAEHLRSEEPGANILVLGTKEGLEARLVPERGFALHTIARLPFPRRLNRDALRFVPRFREAVRQTAALIEAHGVDVVIGFGGYASAPAYRAARRMGVPYVIHEANAKPGLANLWGARHTPFVGVAFRGTTIRGARWVGMPLRAEIAQLQRHELRAAAAAAFDLNPEQPIVLVTGGSLGARSLNEAMFAAAGEMAAHGIQVLHVWGQRTALRDPQQPGYLVIPYCDRMDLALAAADIVLSRSGASTVSELSALGVPAIYVPYPHGNGEQRNNVTSVVAAGGALLCEDAELTGPWLVANLIPLVRDPRQLERMSVSAAKDGARDGAQRVLAMIRAALGTGAGGA